MMSSMAPPPSAAVQPPPQGAPGMQKIGQAQGQQQAGQEGMKNLLAEVQALGKQTMRVAQVASVSYKPLLAYVEKMAEIGKAMQETLEKAAQDSQQGAAPVQTSTDGRSPTESAGGGES